MHRVISALFIITVLGGCQAQHIKQADPLQSVNAGSAIAQPPDMALRTAQLWLLKNFPDTVQPVQAINQPTGEIRAHVHITIPCSETPACQSQADRTISTTLRIKILPQRAAINFSNIYWLAAAQEQAGAADSTITGIQNTADKQRVKNHLNALANRLFSELAVP